MSYSAGGKKRSIRARIDDVGRDLAGTFGEVLNAIPGGPHRPQRLARRLGVNAVLTSRLLKATKQQNPLVVAHVIPGPEPLHRLLKAAEKLNVNRKLIQEAEAAVERFQQLIDAEAGDRSSLDAMISGWLPGAREKVEMMAKQSVFRGVSQLLGTSCEFSHWTFMLVPNAQSPDRADQVLITQMRGLRRLRPGAIMCYDTVHSSARLLTVNGDPVDSLQGLLLEDFCSSPVPQLQVTRHGDVTQFAIAGHDVGIRSTVDLAHATFLPAAKQIRRPPEEPQRKAIFGMGIDPPSRSFCFDLLLHQDVFPGQRPTLDIYKVPGAFGPGPANRLDMDRLDMLESVESLGQGVANFHAVESPSYEELLAWVCEQRGWDADELRGFRCRIEYPMYSSEVVLGFDLPARK